VPVRILIKSEAYQDLSWVHAANTHSLLLLRLLGVASSLLQPLYGSSEKMTSEKDTKYSIAYRIFPTCSPFFRFLFRLMRKAGRGSNLLHYYPICTILFTLMVSICPERRRWNCPEANFVEVSGHNLESSQTLGFWMDFLNQREGVWFSSILLYSVEIHKRLREFEEIEISRQSCTVECRGDCE
jgi:hypothetical protein